MDEGQEPGTGDAPGPDVAADTVRPHLVAAGSGMQRLWQEAHEGCASADPGSPQWTLWRSALDKVVLALDESEQVAAGLVPELGRRTWAARPAPGSSGTPGPATG